MMFELKRPRYLSFRVLDYNIYTMLFGNHVALSKNIYEYKC